MKQKGGFKEDGSTSIRRRVARWSVLLIIVPVQTLLLNKKDSSGYLYQDGTSFEKCRHVPLSQWSDEWLGRLYSMDVDLLQVFNMSA